MTPSRLIPALLLLSSSGIAQTSAPAPTPTASPSQAPKALITVTAMSPNPDHPVAQATSISVDLAYSISRFDETLRPYTAHLQFKTVDGNTLGDPIGPSTVELTSPVGTVHLETTFKAVLKMPGKGPGLVYPLTMFVYVDHDTPRGSKIIGKAGPFLFRFGEGGA